MTTPVISGEAIGWKIGGAQILDDVSLDVGAGELLGIIGPNGAGKSSLVNILSGVTRARTTGSVRLGGDDVTKRSATRRARLGLARSFQTSALFDGLTAGENVHLAVQASSSAPFSFRVARPGRDGGAGRTWTPSWSGSGCRGRRRPERGTSRTVTAGSWSSPWPWPRTRRSCS